MATRLSTCEGIVLGRRETGERHWQIEVFSPAEGAVRTLARRGSSKRPQSPPPDLFQSVTLELEQSARGPARFIREARCTSPYAGIGQDYETLVEATGFGRTIWKNLTHAESFDALFAITHQAMEAFARRTRPEVTHFKSLYLFARTEGYPVKEQMLASWDESTRQLAHQILSEPLAGDQPPAAAVRQVLERLRQYLRGYTDILI